MCQGSACMRVSEAVLDRRAKELSQKLREELDRAAREATALVARGNVYLAMGHYVTERESLAHRRKVLSRVAQRFI